MNAQLKAKLTQWAEGIDQRSLRERAMIFGAVMVLLYVVTSVLVFGPLEKERGRLAQTLKDKQTEIEVFNAKIQSFVTQSGRGETERQARLTQLQQELKGLDNSVGQINKRLVPPREMARLIAEVSRNIQELQILKIENLPSTVLTEKAIDKGITAPAMSGTVYKHGMRVQVRGTYSDIVQYLKSLEALPWKMYWGELSLVTDQYPYSTATIVVYTLSLDEAWIGV